MMATVLRHSTRHQAVSSDRLRPYILSIYTRTFRVDYV